MWFKNIFAFKINEEEIKEQDLKSNLEDKKIVPCGKNDIETFGWDCVIEDTDELYQKISGAYMLRYEIESKVIPASIVQEKLKEKIKEHIKSTGEKPSKEDKESFKEAIVLSLAQQAFIQSSYINGYLDYKNGYLVIDASSPKKADEFLSYLRETLGQLDVDLLEPNYNVGDKMTEWLKGGDAPSPFELEEGCVLKDVSGTGSKITADKHNLTVEEITKHIEEGKIVEQVDLNWHERISFRLCSDFKIKKIKPKEVVKETIEEELGESDDNYSTYKASMYIMVEDFAEMLSDLIKLK